MWGGHPAIYVRRASLNFWERLWNTHEQGATEDAVSRTVATSAIFFCAASAAAPKGHCQRTAQACG